MRSYYENILSNIESIIGDNKKRHPILENALNLSFKNKDLNYESSIYSQNFFMKKLINLKLKMTKCNWLYINEVKDKGLVYI